MRFTISFILFLVFKFSLCQDTSLIMKYKNSVGIRGGFTTGINYRHILDSKGRAVELLVGVWPDAYGFSIMLEKFKATEIEGLLLYLGGGVHYTDGNNRNYYTYRNGRKVLYKYVGSDYSLGFDLPAGAEYKIPKVPFIINMEVKPMLEFGSNGDSYFYIDPALGVKVCF